MAALRVRLLARLLCLCSAYAEPVLRRNGKYAGPSGHMHRRTKGSQDLNGAKAHQVSEPSRTPLAALCAVHHQSTGMQGELAATAVNAPMVSAEVLAELQPFVALAQGLGTAAVQLVGSHGFTDIHLTYATSRGGVCCGLWTCLSGSFLEL